MPRSRVTEVAQRPSPRGPPSLHTASSSDSDPSHTRPRTERSPKIADGRPQRGTQSQPNPPTQKKLGTRIADLESQLGLAQEELKSLKHQLVPTDVAMKVAKHQLEKKPKKFQKSSEPLEIEEKHSTTVEDQKSSNKEGTVRYETSDDVQRETDVFEVPTGKSVTEPKRELELPVEEDEFKPKSASLSTESPVSPLVEELASKDNEINLLKANLDEKEKELDVFRQENEGLKRELEEKTLKISSSQSEIDEMHQRLNVVSEELEKSKSSEARMNEKLEAMDKSKEALENEMRMLRVQTKQWRKAADAAASVLSEEVEGNGRRISKRCGSMDKLYGNTFDSVGGYTDYAESPGLNDDGDDVFGGEKRKGIRMFGDLWKKKSQK